MKSSQIVRPAIFARNLLANWVGVAASSLVAFFLTPLIIYKLGTSTYGIWSLVHSLIGYLGLIDMGIRGSVGRYINYYLARDDNQRVNQVVSTSISFLTIVCLVGVSVAYVISINFKLFFPKTPNELLKSLEIILPLMSINVWLAFMTSIFRNIMMALDRFEVLNGISLGMLVLQTSGIVLVLYQGHQLIGLAVVLTVTSLVTLVVTYKVASSFYKALQVNPGHANRDRFLEMWKFGMASFTTRAASESIHHSDRVIVMIFLGPSMVAIYSIARTLLELGQKVIEQIGSTLYPSIMKAGSVSNIDDLQRIFTEYARLSFYFGTLIFVGLSVFGEQFIQLWLGPEFIEATGVLAILCFAELLSHFGAAGGSLLFSLDKLRFNLLSSIGEASSNIVLSIVLVSVFDMGIIGVALGTLFSRVAVRTIGYPMYTTEKLGMSFKAYFLSVGVRALSLIIMTYALFNVITQQKIALTWASFSILVLIATIIYFPLATFMMFKVKEISIWSRKIFSTLYFRF